MYQQFDENKNYPESFHTEPNRTPPPASPPPSGASGFQQGPYRAPANPAPKKKGSAKWLAFLLVTVIASGTAGFGGGLAASRLSGNKMGTGTSVLTQSVVNTSEKQESGSNSSVAAIADATSGSVVEIVTETAQEGAFMQKNIQTGAGSGVIITEDGYIATNNHVVDGVSKVTVTLKNGKSYEAKIVGTDETTDLAVLKIEETGLKPAVFGDSDQLEVGDLAVAIGNPLGELGGTVTEGIISALDREITIGNQEMTLLQTSAAVNPGNSGGGLFNGKGELVGIVNAKTSETGIEGLGFAIPSNIAKPVLEDIISNGYVTGRIKLGVSFIDITSQEAAAQYRVSSLGAYVYQVNRNSDADKAGLETGDLIVSIDGTKISESSEIKSKMNDYKVGDTMKLVVSRDGKEREISVTFTEYNPSN